MKNLEKRKGEGQITRSSKMIRQEQRTPISGTMRTYVMLKNIKVNVNS